MSSKVKDGLFLGDIDAAQDAEFLQLNGIVHIVNCVPRQVPNLFQQSLGLSYVACELDEVLRRPFFDLKNRQFMGIVQLIDRALERTESVLVHSLNGLNRSPSVMMGYLMVKYCWGVDKAYEFLLTKRSDIKPHESYIDQLCLLEAQLQTLFGGRATEQQLYEWHPTLMDPLSDEIVLVHTYLNTASTASKQTAKKAAQEPPKAPAARRLSWIDQVTHLKKLYPSLMIKPERPPNHSYSDMLPANGWVDLISPAMLPSSASAGGDPAVPRPIAAFMGTAPSHGGGDHGCGPQSSSLTGDDSADLLDDGGGSAVGRGHRVHSFSVPRRREVEVVDNSLSPSSASSDREDQELVIEVAPSSASVSASAKQPMPRYQQQLRSAPSNRPLRQPQPTNARAAPSQRTAASGSMTPSASSSLSARPTSSSFTGGVASTTMSSFTTKLSAVKTPELAKHTKPGGRSASSRSGSTTMTTTTTVPSVAVARERRVNSSPSIPSGSYSARGSSTGDLPLPQTTPAFSVRRAVVETDPWGIGGGNTSSTARPRTAPPRLRKKDSDPSLYNTKATAAVQALAAAGLSRVNIDVWSLPAGASGAGVPAASFRTPKLSTTKTTTATAAAAAASAARPRTVRAQWK